MYLCVFPGVLGFFFLTKAFDGRKTEKLSFCPASKEGSQVNEAKMTLLIVKLSFSTPQIV